MRGIFISFLSVCSILVFSVGLVSSSSFFEVWLFIELVSLCLIPLFFVDALSGVVEGLFSYLVVSAISSSFVVCGLVCEDLFGLFIFGLLVKFGVFPFSFWVFGVLCHSNWLVVWLFSTFLKVPFFLVCCFFSVGALNWVITFFSCFGLLFFSLSFWFLSVDWFYCWCLMMLSSTLTLLCMCPTLSLNLLGGVFFVYFVWASSVVLFFSSQSGLSGVVFSFLFYLLVLSFPFSFALFYKFVLGFCVFSCGIFVLLGWVVYSVSEQVFFVKYLYGYSLPQRNLGMLMFV